MVMQCHPSSSRNCIVSSIGHRCAIHKVANAGCISRLRQWWTRGMRIWLDVLRMVHRIAGPIQRRAIGQVAHVIHKIGSGQRWTRWVWIRRNRFRVIHGIAGGIHGSTIWKVTNIVSILQISKCIALVGVTEAIVVSHLSTRATWLGGASSNTRLDSGIPPLKWHNKPRNWYLTWVAVRGHDPCHTVRTELTCDEYYPFFRMTFNLPIPLNLVQFATDAGSTRKPGPLIIHSKCLSFCRIKSSVLKSGSFLSKPRAK